MGLWLEVYYEYTTLYKYNNYYYLNPKWKTKYVTTTICGQRWSCKSLASPNLLRRNSVTQKNYKFLLLIIAMATRHTLAALVDFLRKKNPFFSFFSLSSGRFTVNPVWEFLAAFFLAARIFLEAWMKHTHIILHVNTVVQFNSQRFDDYIMFYIFNIEPGALT